MENNVIISIRGRQTRPGEEDEVIDLLTEGTLERTGDTFLLSYEESPVTGLENTHTTFRIEPACISLLRTGAYHSELVFARERRHLSLYDTPFGSLSVGVRTHSLSSELDEHGGVIDLDYALELDHMLAGRNFFHITVQEKGTPVLS